jgi:hypothetical protein
LRELNAIQPFAFLFPIKPVLVVDLFADELKHLLGDALGLLEALLHGLAHPDQPLLIGPRLQIVLDPLFEDLL